MLWIKVCSKEFLTILLYLYLFMLNASFAFKAMHALTEHNGHIYDVNYSMSTLK